MKRGSIAGFLAGGALLRRRPCSSFPSPSPSPLSSILRPRMFSSAERQDFVLSPEIVKIMNTRMKAVEWRHAQLTNVLLQPGTSPDDYAKSNKELSKLEELVRCISTLRAKQKEIISLQTLMDESADDVEICKMAMDELQSAQKEESKLQQAVLFQMLPRDEADSKSCILEVRAGTGGEEAALFAVDLFKMYERYALGNSWKFEVVDIMETGIGGYKVNLGEIDIAKNPNLILAPTNDEFAIYCLLYNDLVQEASALIAGVGAYGKLKFESGVHRVQRVPLTEKSGRIHTSAASVAVLPKADEVDVQMRNEDLRIDTYRSGGSGGQHANTTNSAVRITHIPTGLVVAIQDERSQHMNKAKAMEVLRSRLYEIERRRVSASHSELRQELIGSGDRSERIRTYNFPQGRVTDHRVGITQHAIESVMQGEGLDTFIDALKMKEEAGSLAYLIGS